MAGERERGALRPGLRSRLESWRRRDGERLLERDLRRGTEGLDENESHPEKPR